jgi:HPt (histidine-containing phosphotransfer) domain-containing protein
MADPSLIPLAEAMNRLWEKHLLQMQERVATLQRAAENLANGTLTATEQQLAAAEAHKLAGVLGTFGLKEGTELAREAEALYESSLDTNSVAASRLSAIARQLRASIASRSQKA